MVLMSSDFIFNLTVGYLGSSFSEFSVVEQMVVNATKNRITKGST